MSFVYNPYSYVAEQQLAEVLREAKLPVIIDDNIASVDSLPEEDDIGKRGTINRR